MDQEKYNRAVRAIDNPASLKEGSATLAIVQKLDPKMERDQKIVAVYQKLGGAMVGSSTPKKAKRLGRAKKVIGKGKK